MNPVVLEAMPLRLRPLTLEDAPAVNTYMEDEEISRNTANVPYPYSLALAQDWVTRTLTAWEEDNYYTFGITWAETDQLLGAMGVHPKFEHDRAEIGYWMGKPHRSKGYTSHALKRVIQFGFETLKLNRIQADYYVFNPASRRVMEKAGMTFESLRRQYYKKGDRYIDMGGCVILAETYFSQ